MVLAEQNLQVELKKVLVAMEAKRTDFDNIQQDVNKVKTYATDLQTFIGVNKMTSVNAASMYLRSLSMCTMAVDDLAFSVTSRMGRNSWQWW
jgi:hypothetical protein